MEGNDQAARAEDAKHRTGYYPPIRRETMAIGDETGIRDKHGDMIRVGDTISYPGIMPQENPYEYDRTAPPLRSQATQRLMCRAWEEGRRLRDDEIAARDATILKLMANADQQAEIVSELVGALGETLEFIDAVVERLPNPVRGERRLTDYLPRIKQALAKGE
ncbi:hypothetical protein LCGC14_2402950 [marine sediment metagenome]|uniref:Uncharacterized protein n=1 Tax=marine sediment metagenome TaxID=412755 RepID=A0A0F9E740_9ZZZZ